MRDPKDESSDERAAKAVFEFSRGLEKLWEDDYTMLSFSVRLPEFEGGEYLLVVRVEKVEQKFVAFRSADSLPELMAGFVRAMRYKTLKFRKDNYGDRND